MSVDALRARSRLSDGISAAPELVLAVSCLAAIFIPEAGKRFAPRLLLTLGMEFLGIHAFVFLGALALMRPRSWWSKTLRAIAFITICILYSFFAANWGGEAVASFWVLTLSTYFGFFVHDAPQDRRRMLVCRWVVVAATYLGLMLLCALVYRAHRCPRADEGLPFRVCVFCCAERLRSHEVL